MGLFSFLKFLKPGKAQPLNIDPEEYVPSFWEDDYCQIEIVPYENKAFIEKQLNEIEELAAKSKSEYGFTSTFGRDSMPVETITKEIRVDYLEYTLTGFEFSKARYIKYNRTEILDCKTGKTKAYGFPNFTIFFDTEEEFVKNIWISIRGTFSSKQLNLIKSALYTLGEECELILIDWNNLELYDLKNRNQIDEYLMGYWK